MYLANFRVISAGNPPVIIHCSAGIGRTGVLILMDTALSLIEIREPVYPLDIVRAMRDQRACMIQNAVSINLNFINLCKCTLMIYVLFFRVNIVLFVNASMLHFQKLT